MIIIKPRVMVPRDELDDKKLVRLERCARICYKSEDRMGDDFNPRFLESILSRGHESVIEHEKVTVLFVVDRGVSHEIVRHRIASYSQESTRYCNYSQDKFGREITLIEPYFLKDRPSYSLWKQACQTAEECYIKMLDEGCSPQEARSVLPNSLKTELAATFNMREWRHFFLLRCAAPAHPQMRQVAIPLLHLFQEKFPVLFNDIPYDESFPQEHYAEIIISDDQFRPEQ
ncbi:MAG: FAD-dependent thymidylate synthase [Syntrophomonadaceae bacterium]|jgi:thymidylate synthase (FAD)|nr:FAD-dependent thymidylate synthase [Bacillota bacterium]NLM87470.1 FAD-dependent thymidylate synthase [Syntrophomonadaceae bacterium]HQA49478.1 FAD-dependent thymidylate synthase [Syntrophomonadaceae bacterium]HQD91219.1 FAD-dependent thymidylate synthase [Syntrophomonadaceae bacterium]